VQPGQQETAAVGGTLVNKQSIGVVRTTTKMTTATEGAPEGLPEAYQSQWTTSEHQQKWQCQHL